MPKKSSDPGFEQVFEALREILMKHEAKLVVEANAANNYALNSTVLAPNRKPMFFGGVSVRKNSVNYYLMPVYTCPDLLNGMSPELKARMQGKSCFNFKNIDSGLFAELAKLTDEGYERFERDGWI
ncbi:MAG: hypothetical protein OER90_09025 [Gemmatimonadota bacterium]|nr:hypothetical protein [Gemmatimonadota bacterium]